MKVLDLKAKTRDVYALTLEDHDQTITVELHQDTVVKHRLFTVKTIDAKQLKMIKDDDAFHRAYVTAIKKLAQRNLTPRKLKQALRRANVDEKHFEAIIDKLTENRYLDEQKQLAMFVEDFLTFELRGKDALKHALHHEGFDQTAIEKALCKMDDAKERAICETFLEKKAATLKASDALINRKRKLYAACLQKGFTRETIDKTLEAFMAHYANQHDEEKALDEAIERNKRRYNLKDRKEHRRLLEKLMREGFAYDAIKRKL